MIAIVSLLVVIATSLMIVRVATVALTLTGISKELARFQARSAFSGTGFTSKESEQVMHHPVRRRIIMLLMLLGNAGIVTAVSSLVLSLADGNNTPGLTGQLWFRLSILTAGMALLWTIACSSWVDRRMYTIIQYALKRWTDLELRDYAGLLHLSHGYIISEMAVEPNNWLAGQTLIELKLSTEGVLVLGVEKADGSYYGAPRGKTLVEAGDVLYLYGRQQTIAKLDARRAGFEGNWEHHKSVSEQMVVEKREREEQEKSHADATN